MAQQTPEPILLWPEGIPGARVDADYTETQDLYESGQLRGLTRVSQPTLTVFQPDAKPTDGTAVVICPGGGYQYLAIEKEGYKVARWLNSLGVTAIVLKYRLPYDGIMEDKAVGPLQDAQEALRWTRRNAGSLGLNPGRIGIMGFSAGGHLASSLSTHYAEPVYTPMDDTSARPDFSILIYPVISMQEGVTHGGSKRNLLGESPEPEQVARFSNEWRVTPDTPPAFLVHATDDLAVPVSNSIRYYQALQANGIPVELHSYQSGGHGFGLGTEGTHTDWPKACARWLSVD